MLVVVIRWLSGLAVLGLILGGVATVVTQANAVPATHAFSFSRAITPDDLKPAACAGFTVTNLVVGGGAINGTSANDLILGSAGDDQINGGSGQNCCLGGAGTNTYKKCAVAQ